MNRKILHIDMDAFFAAVEQLDNPEYRGKAVIVGGNPQARGVVSTCSYEARVYGVHSAMPLREAYRRCPHGIFVPVRGSRYAEISRKIMILLSEYTPLVEPLSLDEAFLDLTGSESIFGPAVEIAKTIVSRIKTEIGLNGSIGLAPNKFLAKMGSDLRKPNGFVVINPEDVLNVLEDLPIGKLWGVGEKTEAVMLEMGIRTIGMLRRIEPELLKARFGDAGIHFYQLARGIDERPVQTGEETKSIGHEITFQIDTDDYEFLAGVLLGLCDQVARRLRYQRLKGRIITLKIRDRHFKTMTKRTTLDEATDFEEVIYRESLRLAQTAQWGKEKVRLLGVSLSGFDNGESQLTLFNDDFKEVPVELDILHQTVDRLKNKFGESIITKGTILNIKRKIKDNNKSQSLLNF